VPLMISSESRISRNARLVEGQANIGLVCPESCRLLTGGSPVAVMVRQQCTPHRTGPPWVLGPQDQGYGTVYTTECRVAGNQCFWVTGGAACPGSQAREAL